MLGPDDLVFCSVPQGHVPLLDRLAPVRAAGFAGLSLQPADIWTLEESGMPAREIAARIADAGLQVAEVDCIASWLPRHQEAATGELGTLLATLTADRVLGAARRVGARSVAMIEMSGVEVSRDEAAEAFAAICDRAAEDGLLVHIEFLPFGGIPDLASAWAIVEAAGRPNGGLTVDSWHMLRSGSTLAQLETIPGAHIGSVQINDAPATSELPLIEETMSARLLPGEGAIDVAGLIRTLDRIGSKAPIGVEVFSTSQQSQSIAEVARNWARSAMAVMNKARGVS